MGATRLCKTDHRKPEGMSVVSLLAVVTLVAGVVVLALRLGPHYIDFQTLDSIMDGLPSAQIHEMDKAAIRDLLTKRYKINNIRDLNLREVVSIERKKDSTDITIDYEIREPLVYNIDAVLTFSETYSYR